MTITRAFSVLGSWILVGLISLYRYGISPLLPPRCRFQPTCSAYALEAVRRHGPLRGGLLASRRVLRCHPWGGHGYDPVPPGTVPVDGDISADMASGQR